MYLRFRGDPTPTSTKDWLRSILTDDDIRVCWGIAEMAKADAETRDEWSPSSDLPPHAYPAMDLGEASPGIRELNKVIVAIANELKKARQEQDHKAIRKLRKKLRNLGRAMASLVKETVGAKEFRITEEIGLEDDTRRRGNRKRYQRSREGWRNRELGRKDSGFDTIG